MADRISRGRSRDQTKAIHEAVIRSLVESGVVIKDGKGRLHLNEVAVNDPEETAESSDDEERGD